MSQNNHYVLEHFEDKTLAVLEDPTGKRLVIPCSWLPEGSKEGDLLKVTLLDEDAPKRKRAGSSLVVFERDTQATQKQLERLASLRASLPQASEGDIDL